MGKQWLGALRTMPPAVLSLFGVFFAIPFASLWLFGAPWNVWNSEGGLRAALMVAAYWALPLTLCAAMLRAHWIFVPTYFVQCLALLAHSILYSDRLPLDIAVARYVMIALMAYVGLFFGNKDFLSPFLTLKQRFWRRFPRLAVRYEIQLVGERPEHKIPAWLVDVSANGFAIRIDERHLESFVKKKSFGQKISVVVRWQGKEQTFETEIVREEAKPAERILGLRAAGDPKPLSAFVEWARYAVNREAQILHRPRTGTVLETELHQTAMALWVLFIALSFGLPAVARAFMP